MTEHEKKVEDHSTCWVDGLTADSSALWHPEKKRCNYRLVWNEVCRRKDVGIAGDGDARSDTEASVNPRNFGSPSRPRRLSYFSLQESLRPHHKIRQTPAAYYKPSSNMKWRRARRRRRRWVHEIDRYKSPERPEMKLSTSHPSDSPWTSHSMSSASNPA